MSFYLYEVLRVARIKETDRKWWLTRDKGREKQNISSGRWKKV